MVSLQSNQVVSEKIVNKKKLVLLDAHAILHRAFHALPKFTSPAGEPTGALYGFISFLLKMIKEINPDYIVGCYDLPEKTFRHEVYKEYKGTRAKVDDLLIPQFNRSCDILSSMNIQVYSYPGFEADDMLGTIVKQVEGISGLQVVIASGDLDTLQLVKDDDVVVYTLRKGINDTLIYNEDSVKERFHFAPEFLVDYKGLRGDPSDNIIGVPGIGEKGATDIISSFGHLENLFNVLKTDRAKLEEKGIKPRILNLLEENEESALFSKSLSQIRNDAPIKFNLEKAEWKKGFNFGKAEFLFKELGFKTLLDRQYFPLPQ